MKFIGQKFLIITFFIPVFIFGLLFFSQPAEAEGETFNSAGTQTIGAGNNQVMVCVGKASATVPTWNGVSLISAGSIADGKVYNYNNGNWVDQGQNYVFYLANPDVGTHSLSYNGAILTCYVKDNINQDDPILAITNKSRDGLSFTITTEASSSAWVLAFNEFMCGGSSPASCFFTNSWNSLINNTHSYDYNVSSFSSLSYNFTTSANSIDYSENLQSQKFFIELNTYIEPVTPPSNIEILDMSTLANTYLWFDSFIQYCDINTTCKINYNYDTQLFSDFDIYKLYYYQTSTSTASYLGEHVLGTRYNITGESGSGYIYASSTATSSVFSYYELVPYSSALSKFMGTTTVAVGFKSTTTPETIIADYNNSSSGKAKDQMVVELVKALCETGDSNLVCTAKVTPYYIYIKATNLLTNLANQGLKLLGNMFPFNFATLIDTTWKTSATTPIPSDLAWLVPTDANNEVNINFKILDSMPTSTITIWSPDFFTNEAFEKVKGASKYVWYLALLFFVYIYGKIIYSDLIGKEEKTENI